jgi:hypothetical protein
MQPTFFKQFSLVWTYPVRMFMSGNKTLDEIRALTKEKAIEYFRKAYPELNDEGYAKHENGSLIVCERFEIF